MVLAAALANEPSDPSSDPCVREPYPWYDPHQLLSRTLPAGVSVFSLPYESVTYTWLDVHCTRHGSQVLYEAQDLRTQSLEESIKYFNAQYNRLAA